MIRPTLFAAALIALAGCDTAPPDSMGAAASPAGVAVSEPVDVMDPGAISCASIATATDGRYIDAATLWATGQMRAAVLSGALPGPAPQEDYDEGIATFIADYCRGASTATVRDAVNAMVAG